MKTLRELKEEIDKIYDDQPGKRDKYVFIYTPETPLDTEDIYHIEFIDDDISDRVDINLTANA